MDQFLNFRAKIIIDLGFVSMDQYLNFPTLIEIVIGICPYQLDFEFLRLNRTTQM